MVLQLTQDQVLRLTPAEGSIPNYTQVIFLEQATNDDSVIFAPGRRGSKAWDSQNRTNRYYARDNRRSASVPSVALINTPVEEGDRVVILTEGWYQGHEATATHAAYSTDALTVRHDNGSTQTIQTWVTLAGEKREPKPVPVVDPEDMKLSQWWINRIKTYAAKGKRSNNWCSEIDKLVRDLLEPVLVKWKTEPGVEPLEGYNVIDPDGAVVAWFKDQTEADALVSAKNKKLTV